MRLLVAEDDDPLRDVIGRGLHQAGYVVDLVARGDDALDQLFYLDYAAAIVDWRMPGLQGIDVIRAARRRGARTPFLMLTARDTPADRIAGLDAGSDDYLVKPFEFGELLARLRALLRRMPASAGAELRVGRLVVDPARRQALIDGTPVAVTPKEFTLLDMLAVRSPGTVSRQELVAGGWPDGDEVDANRIEVHVARLRAKLAAAELRIEAVRGAGYRLVQQ